MDYAARALCLQGSAVLMNALQALAAVLHA
jgi:hypothetical protein